MIAGKKIGSMSLSNVTKNRRGADRYSRNKKSGLNQSGATRTVSSIINAPLESSIQKSSGFSKANLALKGSSPDSGFKIRNNPYISTGVKIEQSSMRGQSSTLTSKSGLALPSSAERARLDLPQMV